MRETTDSASAIRSEAALVQRVCDALNAMGWKTLTEVGIMSRSADIVASDDLDNLLTIECKLHDWRSAVRQASDHKVSCSRVAICMPRAEPSNAMREVLEREGIGFIGYDVMRDHLVFAVEPKPSPYYLEAAGRWLSARVRERGWA